MHPQQISRLVNKRELIRLGRGRYALPQTELSENLVLALVAAAVPLSVVCLLSALRFHGIGTEASHEVWIAVEQGTTRPRLDYPGSCDANLRFGFYIRC
jgi:predicted transcriptional regulator of viral defense system